MKNNTIAQGITEAFRLLIRVYFKYLLIFGFVVYGLSGFYEVKGDSVGVQTRFGKIVNAKVLPGLHYRWPWPIDNVVTVSVREVKTLVIDDFSSKFKDAQGGASNIFYRKTGIEPYCITGDNNIVAITLVIKYTIDDPVKYIYGMKQPGFFMERCAADLIVHHLASQEIDEVLTLGKKQLEFELKKALSKELDKFNTGICLTFFEIKEIAPPPKVQEDFDKVINAEVAKKKSLNEAQGYLNRVVPAARTEANKTIQAAAAYKSEKIFAAQGETARFASRYKAYLESPGANQERIYLEFVRSVFPKMGQIRVVNNRKQAKEIVVPVVGKD